jgi:hypothetical protein
VSVLLGALSFLSFIGWFMFAVPVLAVVTGVVALKRIRKSPLELTGRGLAYAGVVLAIVFWVVSIVWNVFDRYYSVPSGYESIAFSELDPEADRPDARVSERAVFLDGRKVFLRGFMYPGKQKTGLREFLLMDDNGACAFCNPTPKPSRMIRVRLPGDMRIGYTTQLIGIGGKLTVHTDPAESEMGGLVYQIDADIIR